MPIAKSRLATRTPRLGSISLGWQDAKPADKKTGEIVTFPRITLTPCFHSDSLRNLEIIQARLNTGGEIRQSVASEEKFDLINTTIHEVRVLLPATEVDRCFSQDMEAHGRTQGLMRRCDGEVCSVWRDAPKTERDQKTGREFKVPGELQRKDRPCICDADDLPDKERCKPVMRLNVLLADCFLELDGLGVWLVRSTGWATNAAIAGALELLEPIIGGLGMGVPFLLKTATTQTARGEKPQFLLQLATSPREAMAAFAAGPKSLLLPAGDVAPPNEDPEPVGTFVPEDEHADGEEPVEGELVAGDEMSAGESAAAPDPQDGESAPGTPHRPDEKAGTRQGQDPGADTPQTIHGILVEPLPGPHVDAPTDVERATKAQWSIAYRHGKERNLEPTQVIEVFQTRYPGLKFPSKDALVEFSSWLGAQPIQGRLAG